MTVPFLVQRDSEERPFELTVETVYLNGGSETRRATRDYYAELYRSSNKTRVEFNGYSVRIVTVGGGQP